MRASELDALDKRIGRERGRPILLEPDQARRLVAAARQVSGEPVIGGAVVRLVVVDLGDLGVHVDLKSDPGFPGDEDGNIMVDACTIAQRHGLAAAAMIAKSMAAAKPPKRNGNRPRR